ncbi:MAG: methylmalonyl-CoA mutase, partial [Clostridiaceae bacterium]|nr:methylmalonyl-CoA mutase [Clostridiaceae bacterium]MBW4861100.1 methylmalonyl-CoA mutase [Clostridiaceae bacterium]MBW4867725.1 methylmalonyl-CoA mutase [Clostridiaceae bacterium]
MFNDKELTNIKNSKREWENEVVDKAIKRFPERKEKFSTTSEIEVERLYTPEAIGDLDYEKDLGYPGEYPYTRGVQPTMYRGR